MRKRSKTLWFLGGTAGVIAVLALLIMFRTGPVASGLHAGADIPLATAADMSGVVCEVLSIPVRLGSDAWFTHDVVGSLCRTGEPEGMTLAVTVSGAGYDSVYWDFPYRPDTYSFTRAALRRGLVTFNFDRLGMGRSDRPFGLLLGVDNQAFVLQQVIRSLTGRHDFGAVVTIGHSFGSTIALAHALAWPDSVDGIVLTGFVHNSNPGFNLAMRSGVDLAALKGPFAGAIVDPTYLISKAGSRGGIFYSAVNADPAVVGIDELFRQTTTIGEVISMSTYFGEQSKRLTVPAYTLIGEDDFVVCGGAVECTDHEVISAWEAAFFPPEACHEITVVDDTNHNANLHLNAPENFRLILDWIARRVGSGVDSPSEPCVR